MPELPEVETIRTQLEKFLKGHCIENVEVRDEKILQGDALKLKGGRFKEARRFGKVTVLDFSTGFSVLIHVKLTGQLIYKGPNLKAGQALSKKVFGGVPGKHTHVIFHLDRGGKLYYNDYRKFGWLKICSTSGVEHEEFIKKLGPEPLDGLTLEKFKALFATRRNVKTLLMDQTKIGGVGNIYANDALFLAKINPNRSANSLNEQEICRLYDAIEEVLRAGLKYGGASELAFVTPDGGEGKYQEHALVYGRQGQDCPNSCGEKVKKIFLGGRGTYFCSHCQK